jgi:hypothetical protein
MNSINLVDETLDINLTLSYILSIQICCDGFSFCIFDPVREKFIAIFHHKVTENATESDFNYELHSFIENEEFLNQHYKKVRVLYHSQKFTFVPLPLYDFDFKEQYFNFHYNLIEGEELLVNKIEHANSANIFAIKTDVKNIILRQYKNAEFYHQSIPVIENNLLTFKHKNKIHKVFVNVHEKYFDLSCIKGNQLVLFNTFDFTNTEDFVYHILNVYEQLKLNAEETELVFLGYIDKKAELYTAIKKYIRHIRFEKFDETFMYSYTFFDLPSSTFSNLFGLQKCV